MWHWLNISQFLQILTSEPDHIKVEFLNGYIHLTLLERNVRQSLPRSSLTMKKVRCRRYLIYAHELTIIFVGDMFKSIMKTLLGVGVFNSDGEMWKCVSRMFQ